MKLIASPAMASMLSGTSRWMTPRRCVEQDDLAVGGERVGQGGVMVIPGPHEVLEDQRLRPGTPNRRYAKRIPPASTNWVGAVYGCTAPIVSPEGSAGRRRDAGYAYDPACRIVRRYPQDDGVRLARRIRAPPTCC